MDLIRYVVKAVVLEGLSVREVADQSQRGLEIQSRGEDPADHDIVDALGNPVVILDEVPSQFR